MGKESLIELWIASIANLVVALRHRLPQPVCRQNCRDSKPSFARDVHPPCVDAHRTLTLKPTVVKLNKPLWPHTTPRTTESSETAHWLEELVKFLCYLDRF